MRHESQSGREQVPSVRASDDDREQAIDRLREAAARGLITMTELDERAGRVYTAQTRDAIGQVTSDLRSARGDGAPGWRWSIGFWRRARRRGQWVVPARHAAFALLGAVSLDLRDASFAQHETRIFASAVLGGVVITLPEGVEVYVDGFGLLGHYGDVTAEPPAAGVPVVRISGLAVLSGVVVRRRPASRPALRG
jgi:hypothetical protein